MMMDNLRGRLRSWLHQLRPGSAGAIPTTLQPISRTIEPSQPPPIPIVELPQLESDIVVMEAEDPETRPWDEDPDMRAWADAFAAATAPGQKS